MPLTWWPFCTTLDFKPHLSIHCPQLCRPRTPPIHNTLLLWCRLRGGPFARPLTSNHTILYTAYSFAGHVPHQFTTRYCFGAAYVVLFCTTLDLKPHLSIHCPQFCRPRSPPIHNALLLWCRLRGGPFARALGGGLARPQLAFHELHFTTRAHLRLGAGEERMWVWV